MTPSICHTLNTTQRDQLEQVLVSDVAIELAKDPSKAKSLAEGIKSFLDALHPKHQHSNTRNQQVSSMLEAAIKASGLDVAEPAGKWPKGVPYQSSGQYAEQLAAGAMSELHVSASVTPADIEASIEVETYFTAANGVIDAGEPYHDALELLTFCVLVLRNGTKVVGINHGAIDPAQHSAERGRQKARTQAVDKLWELEGYVLHSKLAVQR